MISQCDVIAVSFAAGKQFFTRALLPVPAYGQGLVGAPIEGAPLSSTLPGFRTGGL